jgi:hypothetical protein
MAEHDPKLVEGLEWALAIHFSMNRQPHMSGDPRNRLSAMQKRQMDAVIDAALTALRAARPDIAAALDGRGVVVPREATGIMVARAWLAANRVSPPYHVDHPMLFEAYRALIAAAPAWEAPHD